MHDQKQQQKAQLERQAFLRMKKTLPKLNSTSSVQQFATADSVDFFASNETNDLLVSLENRFSKRQEVLVPEQRVQSVRKAISQRYV
jgi:hypothetical protein